MFNDFSKILTENFIIAYLTPSILFIIVSSIVLLPFIPEVNGQSTNNESQLETSNYESITTFQSLNKLKIIWEDDLGVLAFSAFQLSILLMLLNRVLIRTLEGYYFLSSSE